MELMEILRHPSLFCCLTAIYWLAFMQSNCIFFDHDIVGWPVYAAGGSATDRTIGAGSAKTCPMLGYNNRQRRRRRVL